MENKLEALRDCVEAVAEKSEELEQKISDLDDEVEGLEEEVKSGLGAEFDSLDDQMKYDYFMENFDKIDLQTLELLTE